MSTPINRGGPAFPQPDTISEGTTEIQGDSGMFLRDYFAGEALAALIACAPNHGDLPHAFASVDAYRYADAMIKRRSL